MEYLVVIGKNPTDLQESVQGFIEHGFVPQGGISQNAMYMHQAMIKTVKTKETPKKDK